MKRQSKNKTGMKSIERKTSSVSKTNKIESLPIVESKNKIQNTNIPIPRNPKHTYQKYPQKNKVNYKAIMNWGKIPLDYLLTISKYSCSTLNEVYILSTVCKIWRYHLKGEDGLYLWKELPNGSKINNFTQLKLYLEKYSIQLQQARSFQFEKIFISLFNYGSTKLNIPNKLISKLQLQIRIKLNNRGFKVYPYQLRNFNFSSYLFTKINEINQFKYDFKTPHNMFKDKINLQIEFYSKRYKVSHLISRKYCPQDIVQCSIKQKAFNLFLDKNIVFTFFEGDDHFLYIFFQISVLELVNIFRKNIKNKNKESLTKNLKKLPKYKQLAQTQFQNFVQYLKFQSDFQLHLSYHNSAKQIFTHCDTKVYPVQIDQKHAFFDIKIDDSFLKQPTFNLDNKMGMSQSVPNLYLLDLVVKDRDRFLIVFSGFIYARRAQQTQRQQVDDYLHFNQNEMKILQYKGQKYDFKITIIQEMSKNLMKFIKLNLYP